MQNNIFNLFCEILMKLINLLAVLFYHYLVSCSILLLVSMFDRGDKHLFCISQIFNSFIYVRVWKLDSVLYIREDMHNTFVLSKCTPIFISFLLKSYVHKEMVHFWPIEMDENLGEAYT